MKTILFISNVTGGLYLFRKELLKTLAKDNKVIILASFTGYESELRAFGCELIETALKRHGKNPLQELALLSLYKKHIREIKPDIVFTYTIKPNVYGGMACAALKVPYVANITGLGTALENPGMLQRVAFGLYKYGLRKAQKVFFQNAKNQETMLSRGICVSSHDLLPGSGVNLQQHAYEPYPENDENIVLLVIGRIMRDKGSNEIFEAASIIRQRHPNVVFRLLGSCVAECRENLDLAVKNGSVEYLGHQKDVHSFIKDSHATVHASYHEGMANVLLETAAAGRPVIATDVPGCRETYDDGVSGISCKARDVDSLVSAIEQFVALPHSAKAQMGLAGRRKMEREFDRSIVIDKYLAELEKI